MRQRTEPSCPQSLTTQANTRTIGPKSPTSRPDSESDKCARFKSMAQAQRFLSVHGITQNLFRVGRHLLRAANYRTLRDRAFVFWNAVTCA